MSLATPSVPSAPARGRAARPAWVARPAADAACVGRPARIGGLDGLRGLAALLVLLSHMSQRGLDLAPWLDLHGGGKAGVWLFFVLSAFLLFTQMLSWSDTRVRSARSWAEYLVGRVVRIWPLFVVVCLVCWATTAAGVGLPVPMETPDLWATLRLQQGDRVLWTVPVEFKAYLVLPLVALAVRPLAARAPWAAGTALLGGAAVAFGIGPEAIGGTALAPFLGVFLLGCCGAVGYVALCDAALAPGVRRGLRVAAWLAGGAWILLLPTVVGPLSGGAVTLTDLHASKGWLAALNAVLIVGVALGGGALQRVLDARPLRALGRMSYSLYLWHLLPVVGVLHVVGPSTAVAWLVFIAALALAWASERWIEAPTLRRGAALRAWVRGERAA